MFALVDANSFYCNAEQVFNPKWRGKPLIVLSNNDGCIVAANKHAISLGIKKFVPYFQAKSLCKKHDVIVCSSNYELYADLSSKMMQVIGRFAPEQYIYSIDECFLRFNYCNNSEKNLAGLIKQATQLRQTVWKETRLPVCVGLARTLTLTKLANHLAKRDQHYQGICLLEDKKVISRLFTQIAVSDVWGIGRQTAKKLALLGVHNITQLLAISPYVLKTNFNIELQRTVQELRGEACIRWDNSEIGKADQQQIFSTRSVGERITNRYALQQALAKHAAIAAAKARKQGLVCGTLNAFAATSPFDKRPRSFKIVVPFTSPTNSNTRIIQAITQRIHDLYKSNTAYYKIGVGLLNLSSEQHQQFDLFIKHDNDENLMQVLDKINNRYGRDTLFSAQQGINEKWSMRRQFLTPQYSTKWQDIPVIRC